MCRESDGTSSVEGTVARTRELAETHPDVRAALVVGSYASGRSRSDSDIDLVMGLDNRESWLRDDSWAGPIVGPDFVFVRQQDWGPLIERRYRSADGLEVEFGLVTPHWFATPLDAGTAKVLRDGCLIITDGDALAREALKSIDLAAKRWTGTVLSD